MGLAYCWWMNYTNVMDAKFKGMLMTRAKNLLDLHSSDPLVLKEYNDLGGAGKPNCSVTTNLSSVSGKAFERKKGLNEVKFGKSENPPAPALMI
jgi:hypothetical protein